MYGQLGNIKFEAQKGFSSFSRSRETTFAEIPLILGKSALQQTGEKLATINASIQLHSDFSIIENDIAEFTKLREDGEILPLLIGNGLVLGNFVITSINETHRKTAIDGTLIVAVLDIVLKEYPTGDELGEQQLQAVQDGFASDIRKTVPSREVIPPPTEAAEINAIQGEIQSLGADIDSQTITAANVPSQQPALFSAISEAGNTSSVLALEMSNKLNQITFELSNVTDLITAVNDVASLAASVRDAADSAVLGDVQAANENLKVGNANMFEKSGLLAALSAARLV